MLRLRRGRVTKGGERLPGGVARGIRSWCSIRPIVADLVLTVAVTALSIGVLFGSPGQPHVPVSWPAIALTLLGTLPLVALAGSGEVLVTGTVKDLVAGSGLRFQERGKHSLKGVQEPMDVYAASP